MDEKKIETVFAEEKIAKVITCPQAFAIAEKHGIPKAAISEVLQHARDQDPGLPAGLLQMNG